MKTSNKKSTATFTKIKGFKLGDKVKVICKERNKKGIVVKTFKCFGTIKQFRVDGTFAYVLLSNGTFVYPSIKTLKELN